MTDTLKILRDSVIDENEKSLRLPNIQLAPKVYGDVKKTLTKIGGSWKGGKTQAFIFESNPKTLIDKLLNGDKVNLKKDFQFFATPKDVALQLVELAKIEKHHTILEPSIGQCSLVEAINELNYCSNEIFGYELMEQNREIITKKDICNLTLLGEDFLTHNEDIKFDRIIANPPFTKNQDIDHLQKMYNCLNDNGIVVCITSISWEIGNTKKQNDFKKWLSKVNGKVIKLDSNTFKESGTSIETRIIVIDKSMSVNENKDIEILSSKNKVETIEDDIPSFDNLINELLQLEDDIHKSLKDLRNILSPTERKKTALKKEISIPADDIYKQLSLF